MKKLVHGITAFITATALAIACFSVPESALSEDVYITADNNEQHYETDPEISTDLTARAELPDNMKAAFITPGEDFAKSESSDTDAELSAIFERFTEIGLNTVIINTVKDGKAYFSLDINEKQNDPVYKAIETAYASGISPYAVFDLGTALADCQPGTNIVDDIVSKVHRFVMKYKCSGIIIDDYYTKRSISSYNEYMRNGSGIGYDKWLYDIAEQYFRIASEVVKMTDSSVSVGFMINDMWANSSSNSEGSDTTDAVQALYDGHSDTKGFVEHGYVDFALLRAYGSTSSQRLPFAKVTGWWGKLTEESNIPLYIVHHNEYIGTDAAGWNSGDQIIEQLTAARNIVNYGGSVFNSYSALMENPLGTTDALTAYLTEEEGGETQTEEEERGLSMTSPTKTVYTTSEESVTFMGSFDSAYPVYFNGEEITLNDAGNLYFEQPLEAGVNTFEIKHKDQTVTYKITRKIAVFSMVASAIGYGKKLTVEGGTKIQLMAWAYKGSKVYAVVNGVKVAMSESDGRTDEDDANSSYVRYIGSYIVPQGIVGKRQELGTIRIKGSYNGYEAEAICAELSVSALPQPVQTTAIQTTAKATETKPPETTAVTTTTTKATQTQTAAVSAVTPSEEPEYEETDEPEYEDPDEPGTSDSDEEEPEDTEPETSDTTKAPETTQAPETTTTAAAPDYEPVAYLNPVYTSSSLKYIRILNDNTIVYDAKTFDDIASPLFSQLPAGTVEVYHSTSGNYYITASGKRIAISDAVVEDGEALGYNALKVKSVGTSNGNSYINLHLDKKTGFNMRLVGNTYYTAWDGDYNLNKFTATHLYITFESITSVTKLPSFEKNLVFKSGKWDTVAEGGVTKFRLILELRQPGVYFGHKAGYDENGDLILSTLSGLTIVIDPGHGYGKTPEKRDPGAIGEVVEADVVLEIAKELEAQLKDAGANVVRLQTESKFLLTKERPNYARSYGCDIYLSIHCNKATGSASGVEAYYFTSYSQPLAAAVSSSIASYYQTYVYGSSVSRDRGAKYSYYYVTLQQDFPSVLIETGFVDNITDAMALASPTHRKGIAAAIVTGLKKYISSSGYSSAPDGYCVP